MRNTGNPGQPYLDEIIYRIVPDSQSRALALQSGQAQLAGGSDIEPFDLPRFQQQPGLTVTMKGWEYYGPLMWIDINKRVKPLDDARVRRAMSMALDRKFILQTALVRRRQGGDRHVMRNHQILRPIGQDARL